MSLHVHEVGLHSFESVKQFVKRTFVFRFVEILHELLTTSKEHHFGQVFLAGKTASFVLFIVE